MIIRFFTIMLQAAIFITSLLVIFNTLIILTSSDKPRVEYVYLKDAQIAYYTRGEGDPLILIEGFGMTMDDWDPIFLQKLAEKRKIIVFDLRQSGLSKGDITKYTLQKAVDDTIGLMDQLKLKKADIFGWSMGSLIAQELAISYPDRVDQLVLASTLSADGNTIYMSEEMGKKLESKVLGSWSEFALFMFPQNEEGKREAESYLKRTEKAVKNGQSPLTPHVDAMVKSKQQEAVGELSKKGNRLSQLSKITRPVLIIGGDDDILIPPQNNEIVAKAIPHAELSLFPGGGHAFLFSEAVSVTQKINQFLQ